MTIITSFEDGVTKIVLNRPDVLNSINKEMALELQKVLKDCEKDIKGL